VNVTSACYECPEALFNPSLLGINADPLPDVQNHFLSFETSFEFRLFWGSTTIYLFDFS
jgi:hypothetical protein